MWLLFSRAGCLAFHAMGAEPMLRHWLAPLRRDQGRGEPCVSAWQFDYSFRFDREIYDA